MKTSTYFALLAEFGTAQIPLEKMCKDYFNLSIAEAARKAAKQSLPVPVFVFRESKGSPYFVKAESLAEYIDQQNEKAKQEWLAVNG